MNTTMPVPDLPLVVRLSSLGDVVLTTGPIAHWAVSLGKPFVVVTKQAFAPIFKDHPGVARIVPVTTADLTLAGWLRLCHRLRLAHPRSPLIDLHGTVRTRLLSARWRGDVKRSPKYTFSRRLLQYRLGAPSRYRRLTRLTIPQRYAQALHDHPPAPELLRPQIHLTGAELKAADRLVPHAGRTPVVALHPYATHPDKAWPLTHWHQLTRLLNQQGVQWRVLGRAERPLFPGDSRDLTNQTDLRTSAALISRCTALVSGDSGPMHLGTAVGTPVVGLFGPTTRHWGFAPSGFRDQILEIPLSCRPCSLHGQRPCPHDRKCLRDISSHRVAEALTALL